MPCFLEQMLKKQFVTQNILYTCVNLQFHAHFKMPCQHDYKGHQTTYIRHQTAEQQFGEILLSKLVMLSNTASYLKNNTSCLIALTFKSSPLSCSNARTHGLTRGQYTLVKHFHLGIWAYSMFSLLSPFFLLNGQRTQIKPENYAKSLTNQEKSCVALIRS